MAYLGQERCYRPLFFYWVLNNTEKEKLVQDLARLELEHCTLKIIWKILKTKLDIYQVHRKQWYLKMFLQKEQNW